MGFPDRRDTHANRYAPRMTPLVPFDLKST